MADFMAGVLDHSNARPAGVTMQVDKTTDFGTVSAVRAISVRDDSFAPLGDVSVKVFDASESGGIDDDTGKCLTDDVCDWSDNDEITNADGNDFATIEVDTDDGDGNAGNMENSETWYAWMGDDENNEFVKGESGEASVTLTAKADALGIRVTADINENASGNQVDVGKDRMVVITAQLIDTVAATDDSNPVAKEGVTLDITRTRGTPADVPGPDDMKTDADGKVTFTIEGPEDPDDDTTVVNRDDVVTFAGDTDGDGTTGTPDDESGTITVSWRNADAAAATGTAKTDAEYAIIDDDKVRIQVTVSYYDQYGNPAASGERLTITVNNPDDVSDDGSDTSEENGARVRSNGTAKFTANLKAAAGAEIAVTIADQPTVTGTAPTAPDAVLAVRHAHKNDDAVSGNRDTDGTNQVIVDADTDRFIIDTGATADDVAGVLYSYDSGDTFIVNKAEVDIDKFEKAIATNGNTVTVVFYSTDGTSIFSVATS